MTRTDILYATPTFIGGMARVLDIGSTLTEYNTSSTPEKADLEALSSDWVVTGNDIRSAMDNFNKEKDVQKE